MPSVLTKHPSFLPLCAALLAGLLGTAHASPAYDAAFTLLTQHHFSEAEAALRRVVQTEPTNAAAYHALSRAIMAGMPVENPGKEETESRVKDAGQCLARASELEPTNAAYLRDFGMSQITGITSIKKGRVIIEQALALNPKDSEAHSFLAAIYGTVPWALGGDKDKAAEHRRAFQELDPSRFALDEINRLLWIDKKFPAAFSLCEALLDKEPESAVNHFLYGYVAATAKTNLERGLASLRKALTLPCPLPTGNSPYSQFMATPSNFWEKIGEIEGQLGHAEESRTAFTKAVELDPSNYWAAKAISKSKS